MWKVTRCYSWFHCMLCWFFQSHFLHTYDSTLNCLSFRGHYFSWYLDALFLIDIFMDKINCCSLTDTVSHYVPNTHTRDFFTFNEVLLWDLVLQLGDPLLGTAFANFWMFLMNAPSPLRTHFLFLVTINFLL
jgi:hypothetical protein